jgi:hypothetical protein
MYAIVTDPAFDNQNFSRQPPVQSQEGFPVQEPPDTGNDKCKGEQGETEQCRTPHRAALEYAPSSMPN